MDVSGTGLTPCLVDFNDIRPSISGSTIALEQEDIRKRMDAFHNTEQTVANRNDDYLEDDHRYCQEISSNVTSAKMNIKAKYSSKECKQTKSDHEKSSPECNKSGSSCIFNITCRSCNKKFETIDDISEHFENPNCKADIVCRPCNKKFETIDDISEHFENPNCKADIVCRPCNKKFKIRDDISEHIEKRHKCPRCDKFFVTTKSVFRHLKNRVCKDVNNGKFVCGVCYAWFTTRDLLREHQRLQHEGCVLQKTQCTGLPTCVYRIVKGPVRRRPCEDPGIEGVIVHHGKRTSVFWRNRTQLSMLGV